MDRFEPFLARHRATRAAADAARCELAASARAEAGQAAERLRARFGVARVWLFGSLARGRFDAGSDIDLAVEGLPEGAIFEAHAVAAEGCSFDVQVVPIERAKPHVRDAVETDGVLLWPR